MNKKSSQSSAVQHYMSIVIAIIANALSYTKNHFSKFPSYFLNEHHPSLATNQVKSTFPLLRLLINAQTIVNLYNNIRQNEIETLAKSQKISVTIFYEYDSLTKNSTYIN